MYNFDPNTYFNGVSEDGVSGAVNSCAYAIKSAVDNYNNKKKALVKKATYTFVNINGTTVKSVKAENSAEALKEAPENSVATEKKSADKDQHKWTEYSWSTTATNYTFTEVGTDKFEAHDIVDGKCTKCGYIALDLDAYNAANDVVLSIFSKDKDKYTEESLNKYREAVKSYTGKQNEFTSQDEVNDATYAIVSAEVLLQKKSVTIKFVVEKEDGTSFTKDSKTADWGHSVNLDTQSNYVSKWTITVNGVTSNMYSNATAIDHVATENATITAYVSNDETETVKYSKVTFIGRNNQVVAIKYVESGTTYETKNVPVPAVPFYDASGWDKATVEADGSDITVRATYVPEAVNENKCGIHFNGETKYYNYDSYVYLFNADKSKKYAMYADEAGKELITYFDGVDFYAPRRDNLYIKEVSAEEMKAAIGFSGSYQQGLKSSFNVKFWLPEGATLIETGVDLVAKYPDGKVKSAHDRATKFNARNEYTYTVSFGDSKKTIEFKPYLTYEKDGTTTTVYGTPQTVEFN